MAETGAKKSETPKRSAEQSTRFGKAKRRLPPEGQLALDEEVKRLVENPLVGDMKTGALKGVRVLKFTLGPLQLLVAYAFNERRNVVELLDVGPHENFYRDLERYVKGDRAAPWSGSHWLAHILAFSGTTLRPASVHVMPPACAARGGCRMSPHATVLDALKPGTQSLHRGCPWPPRTAPRPRAG